MARPSDAERYEALKRAVTDVGLIRRGTLLRRFARCGKAGCRCRRDPPQLHGPYFEWTRKVRGKTISVRIQPDEADLVAEWIANGRQLTRIVSELARVADRLTERALRAARAQAKRPAADDHDDEMPPPPRPRRRSGAK